MTYSTHDFHGKPSSLLLVLTGAHWFEGEKSTDNGPVLTKSRKCEKLHLRFPWKAVLPRNKLMLYFPKINCLCELSLNSTTYQLRVLKLWQFRLIMTCDQASALAFRFTLPRERSTDETKIEPDRRGWWGQSPEFLFGAADPETLLYFRPKFVILYTKDAHQVSQ